MVKFFRRKMFLCGYLHTYKKIFVVDYMESKIKISKLYVPNFRIYTVF